MISCLFVHNKLYYLTITALSLMLVHEHSSIMFSVYFYLQARKCNVYVRSFRLYQGSEEMRSSVSMQ